MFEKSDKNSDLRKGEKFGLKHKVLLISISLLLFLLLDVSLRFIYPVNRPMALYQMDNSAKIYLEDFSVGWRLIPNLTYKAQYNFSPPPKLRYKKDHYMIETNMMGLRNGEIFEQDEVLTPADERVLLYKYLQRVRQEINRKAFIRKFRGFGLLSHLFSYLIVSDFVRKLFYQNIFFRKVIEGFRFRRLNTS